jgi:hypothetical protein
MDRDGITVDVDGLPWVVPAGTTTGEYTGAQVLDGNGGAYLWFRGRLVALLPVCAIVDPSTSGC